MDFLDNKAKKKLLENFVAVAGGKGCDSCFEKAGFKQDDYYKRDDSGSLLVAARYLPVDEQPCTPMYSMMSMMSDSLFMPQFLPRIKEEYVSLDEAKRMAGIEQ